MYRYRYRYGWWVMLWLAYLTPSQAGPHPPRPPFLPVGQGDKPGIQGPRPPGGRPDKPHVIPGMGERPGCFRGPWDRSRDGMSHAATPNGHIVIDDAEVGYVTGNDVTGR